jgi:hypothetical protein
MRVEEPAHLLDLVPQKVLGVRMLVGTQTALVFFVGCEHDRDARRLLDRSDERTRARHLQAHVNEQRNLLLVGREFRFEGREFVRIRRITKDVAVTLRR